MPMHSDRFWRRNTERVGSVRDITASADVVLTERDILDYETINIDTNGSARNVDLPATSQRLRGIRTTINHTGSTAVDMTVRLTAAGATVGTISQNEMADFLCWGSTAGSWRSAVSKAT